MGVETGRERRSLATSERTRQTVDCGTKTLAKCAEEHNLPNRDIHHLLCHHSAHIQKIEATVG